jgi:hypothetical protein
LIGSISNPGFTVFIFIFLKVPRPSIRRTGPGLAWEIQQIM